MALDHLRWEMQVVQEQVGPNPSIDHHVADFQKYSNNFGQKFKLDLEGKGYTEFSF